MKQVCKANIGIEKLKASFTLGITSNWSSIIGLTVVWVAFHKTNVISGFMNTLLTILAFTPVFMGDAIEHYCFGRIKTEYERNWSDIQITTEGKTLIFNKFVFLRAISLLTSFSLATVMFLSFLSNKKYFFYSKIIFVSMFTLNFIKNTLIIKNFIGPKMPSLGGSALTKRSLLVSGIFLIWFIFLWKHPLTPFSKSFILVNGIIYFILSALLHPLPSKFSIFKPRRKRADFSFNVETISTDQYPAYLKEIEESVGKILNETSGFEFINDIKMPLIELPLFSAWGKLFYNEKEKCLLFILASETKGNIHRMLISCVNGNNADKTEDIFYITTDFGAPNAKFPDTVNYVNLAKETDLTQMLKIHSGTFDKNSATAIENSQIYDKIKKLVRQMMLFLETSVPKKNDNSAKQKTTAPQSNSNNNDKTRNNNTTTQNK